MSYSPSYLSGYSQSYSPQYSPKSYQPSVLQLARKGNARAIAHWINSILGPQGVYVQAASTRTGSMKIMVNFQRTKNPKVCIKAREHLVRHICYRLWTLNSAAIGQVRIMGRISGRQDVLWRQTVRIQTPASRQRSVAPTARPSKTPTSRRMPAGARPKSIRSRRMPASARPQSLRSQSVRSQAQKAGHKRFQLLRSLLFSRLALVGFIFCYWILYLEATGRQAADQPTATATSSPDSATLTSSETAKGQEQQPTEAEKAALVQATIPQNPVFDVPPQFKGQLVYEATPPATAEKVVALTFDDGPWEHTTDQILGILKQNNIKATFFMVGQAVQERPAIAKKVAEAGHVIGNHTWKHPMDDLDTATAAQEMGNTAKLIYEATGTKTYLMRPPGGNLGGELANYAKQQGYMVTMWSADSSDYYVSTPLIIDNVLSNTRSGGIVLLHDGGGDRSQTVEALPQIISSLQRQGYKFVTVPELMQMQSRWAQPSTPGSSPLPAPPAIAPPGSPNSQGGHPFRPGVPDSQLDPYRPSVPNVPLEQPGRTSPQPGVPDVHLGQPGDNPDATAPTPAYPPPPTVTSPTVTSPDTSPGLDTSKASRPLPPPPTLATHEPTSIPVALPPAPQPAG